MKLRYYLRGLGIGIVVAAFLMGFAKNGAKESLTDEEIMIRAEALGMVESGVLAEDFVEEPDQAENISAEEAEENIDDTTNVIKEPIDLNVKQQGEVDITQELSEDTGTSDKIEAADKDTEKIIDKNSDEATDKTADKTIDKTVDKATDKNTEKVTDKTTEDAADKKTDKTTEELKPDSYVVVIYGGDGSYTVAKRMEEAGIIESATAFDDFLCQNGYDKRLTTGNHPIKANASFLEMAEALVKKAD